MSNRRKIEWPTLLKDGGWRSVYEPNQYFCSYFRRRHGKKQFVTLIGGVWSLEVDDQIISVGVLDLCLIHADTL